IKVMNEALSDAGLTTSHIDYINTHGTSTQLGDVVEVNAIEKVFGDHTYELNISSTKSMTGHLLGAAGAIEAIANVMAVSRDTVPPTINNQVKDEKLDDRLNLTLNEPVTTTVNAALSNTFGFGGHNAAVIFKKPE
ncbi:MAG: beta-ketoacyl-[acyl-carrier-protein] synthase II, partial [Bacteroidetes bacterium SW_11_45_7]